jgi:hypothetical protein
MTMTNQGSGDCFVTPSDAVHGKTHLTKTLYRFLRRLAEVAVLERAATFTFNMPGRLKGKTAIVTGSSSGLGREIAFAFARQGAQICCVDLYPAPRNAINPATGKADDFNNRTAGQTTHEYLQKAGMRAIFVKADLTAARDVEAAICSMCP